MDASGLPEAPCAPLPEWSEWWIANSLRTDPMSDTERAEAREQIVALYRVHGYEPPRDILFAGGPLSGAVETAIMAGIWHAVDAPQEVSACYGAFTDGDLREAASLAREYTRMVWSAALALQTRVLSATRPELSGLPPLTPLAEWFVKLTRESWRIRSAGNMCGHQNADITALRYASGHAADWAKWDPHERLAMISGPRYTHRRFAVICDRPTVLRHANRLPHCADGPAVTWSDGFALWYWRGTPVPRAWIEAPDTVDAKSVLSWVDIEQRRAATEILGWDRLLSSLSARVIDQDDDPMIGTLLEADLPDSPNTRFLRVLCGTGRTFALCVPPTMTTAREANAWTYSFEGERAKGFRVDRRT